MADETDNNPEQTDAPKSRRPEGSPEGKSKPEGGRPEKGARHEGKGEGRPGGKGDEKAEGKAEGKPDGKPEGKPEGKGKGKPKDGGKDGKPSDKESKQPKVPWQGPGKRSLPLSRLQQKYKDEVVPAVMSEFKLANVNQVPKLVKVMVNTGVGKALENQKLKPELKAAIEETYLKITGQKPVMVLAKKAVANFKVREGAPSAFMVTLRRDRMWHFLDRLINLAIPRIKDFRGVNDKSFDKAGSWAFGLSEQAVWPEINMANVTHSHGMNINLVFDRSSPKMSRFVLDRLGMPFVRPEPPMRRAAEPAKATAG